MSGAACASTADFLVRVLDAPELAREYPLVFDPAFGGATVELVADGDVRTACAILERTLVVGTRTLRCGLIGSVATDPDWRGRGLGTRLLRRAEDTLRERGCTLALLWADRAEFYLERGYAPVGVECDLVLASGLAPALPEPAGVREARAADAPFLHGLHALHPVRIRRSLEEMRALLAIPGMTTLVLERSAAPAQPALPVAYACLGRGRDLCDVVHDWAGEDEDVLALLRAHLERRFPEGADGDLFLLAPPSATTLEERLVSLGADSRRGILGLGKVLDAPAAARLLAEELGSAEAVGLDGETLVVRGPKGGTCLEASLLAALLLGGPEVHGEVRALLGRLGHADVRLPLEPFAFGLDSI